MQLQRKGLVNLTELKTVGEVVLAQLSGDLDHHSARLMRLEIDRAIADARPRRLIIDFSAVTFMDSSGIGLIMGRYKLMHEQGGEVIVARPPAYIKKVLRLAGVDRLAPITDSLEGLIPEVKEVDKIEQTTPQTT
ncbi:MAG: anti-sigma factor antagonist [Ruminococcus sp.]|nr:anti-sigma factor antagonist [Ruminococcus sp.]MBQ8964988.1 anti-sigma factor antagonist [Ruminococcus sp.]